MSQTLIEHEIEQAILAIEQLKTDSCQQFLESFKNRMVDLFKKGHKVLIAGNGGSLADAIHFAEELTGYYRKERPALAAIALSDPAHMSCVANDRGYENIFSRSIEALGQKGDLFIALSTSGNSKNLIKALQVAKLKGLYTASLLGKDGGGMRSMADIEWIVPKAKTADHIQEAHMTLLHLSIALVEEALYSKEHVSHIPSLSAAR